MVNEPSVFEPFKFYCILRFVQHNIDLSLINSRIFNACPKLDSSMKIFSCRVWHFYFGSYWLFICVVCRFAFIDIQSTVVISTSVISNNRLSRRENLVLVLTQKSKIRLQNIVKKRRNCSSGAISPVFHNIFNIYF